MWILFTFALAKTKHEISALIFQVISNCLGLGRHLPQAENSIIVSYWGFIPCFKPECYPLLGARVWEKMENKTFPVIWSNFFVFYLFLNGKLWGWSSDEQAYLVMYHCLRICTATQKILSVNNQQRLKEHTLSHVLCQCKLK